MSVNLEQMVLNLATASNKAASMAYSQSTFSQEELAQEAELDQTVEDKMMYEDRPSRKLSKATPSFVEFVDLNTGEVTTIKYDDWAEICAA